MITSEQWKAHREFHDRLRKERGPASNNPCVDCGKPAQEWSWDNGSNEDYGTKAIGESFDEYSPRCRSCHRNRDVKGWSPSEEAREKMSAAKKGVPLSQDHAAAISASLTGMARAPFTDEHRKNLSEAAKRGWAKRRGETVD